MSKDVKWLYVKTFSIKVINIAKRSSMVHASPMVFNVLPHIVAAISDLIINVQSQDKGFNVCGTITNVLIESVN